MLTLLTMAVNLAGLPALSMPVPAEAGAIASLQVIGASEERVLAFGRAVEDALQAGLRRCQGGPQPGRGRPPGGRPAGSGCNCAGSLGKGVSGDSP